MNIIEQKLIEAWSVLVLARTDEVKTIQEIMVEINVPENLRKQVEIKVAEKTINILSQA